ncbi:hypothetical protein ACFL0R_06590 [Pseudomonadota bacterium]
MNNATTDIILHISQPLSQGQFESIAQQINTTEGVISCNQNTRIPSLIMVAYNASRVRALTLLNKLTRMGFNASLVYL